MTRLADTPAAQRVALVHVLGDASIRETVEQLDLGYSFDDIVEWIPPTCVDLIRGASDYEVALARLAGQIAAAMCLAAEMERSRR